MQLNRQELQTIAEKAKSLWQRLDSDFVPEPANNPRVEKKIEARLKQWREVAAEGDEDLFKKRLAYDGLEVAAARKLLGNGKISASYELPSWTKILSEVLEQTTDFPQEELDGDLVGKYPFLNQDVPVPFEEIFLPCLLVARERLVAASGERYGLLADTAHAALERFRARKSPSTFSNGRTSIPTPWHSNMRKSNPTPQRTRRESRTNI